MQRISEEMLGTGKRTTGVRRAGIHGSRHVEVDLSGVVRGVLADLGAIDRVVVAVPDGTVPTDPNGITELVTYLVETALGLGAERMIAICADSDRSGTRIWITGLDPADEPAVRATLLRRFPRVDGSPTRAHGGPGVGLLLTTPPPIGSAHPERSAAPAA